MVDYRQGTAEDEVDGLKLFYGDGTKDTQLWKCKFELIRVSQCAVVALGQCNQMGAQMFAAYMRPGEEGEVWLEMLTIDQQESWPAIKALFDVKWPLKQ
jgi:hypothetical protein